MEAVGQVRGRIAGGGAKRRYGCLPEPVTDYPVSERLTATARCTPRRGKVVTATRARRFSLRRFELRRIEQSATASQGEDEALVVLDAIDDLQGAACGIYVDHSQPSASTLLQTIFNGIPPHSSTFFCGYRRTLGSPRHLNKPVKTAHKAM
jgi:hypothetical protein